MGMFKFIPLLLAVLTIQCDHTSALRILGVFPLPGKSHYIHGDILLRELARKGHQVDMVSHFPSNKPVDNYRDISVRGSLPLTYNNLTVNETQSFTGFSLAKFLNIAGEKPCDLMGTKYLEELMKTPKGTYDVIIVELFAAQCYIGLGKYLNAPVVGFVTSRLPDWLFKPFANPLNPSYMATLFSSHTQRMTFKERLFNTLLMTVIGAQFNYFLENQVPLVEKYFNRKISSMSELYDDVSLVLVNEHFSIHEIKPSTPDIIAVGGLHVNDKDQKLSPDLQKWLDESTAGCVYFTFGSMVKIESLTEEQLKVFYEVFEKIAPVRVLMKVADEKALPPGLPKNVKYSSWMPQVAVLKHKNVKAFITHGGMLSTQEALAHKVPMVGFPLFGDQIANIQNFAKKKIAVALDLETLSTDKLMDAINAVLKDPTYRNNIAEISNLFLDRPMSALDTAVYWVEYTARHGTVLKSPATELYWWQFYLIDVYGFLVLCLLVALYVIKKLLSLLISCFRKSSPKPPKTTSKNKKNK